jgi:hypothetical protein
MANEYKSFYLKEIQDIINKAALSIMMQPQKLFLGEQAQKVESLTQLNDRISQYNDGIRALAVYLNNVLEKDGETDG